MSFLDDPIEIIKRKIVMLELGQARALREAVLGQPGALARLQAIDDKIVALRATLVSSS